MTELTPLKTNDGQALVSRTPSSKRELEQCQQERNTALAQLLELQMESETRLAALRGRVQQLEERSVAEQADHTAALEALRGAGAEREQQIATLERHIDSLNRAVAELEHQRCTSNQALVASNDRIVSLSQAVAERDRMVEERDAAVAERDRMVEERDAAVTARERHIADLYASRSWRITAPVRYVKRQWRNIVRQTRQICAAWLHALYLALPLPWSLKIRLKGFLFALLSPLFSSTGAYQAWLEFEHSRSLRTEKRRGWRQLRPVIAEWVRALYLVTPLPMTVKVWIKGLVFALFSPLFRDTRAYRDWMEFERAKRNGKRAAGPAEPWRQDAPLPAGDSSEFAAPPVDTSNGSANLPSPGASEEHAYAAAVPTEAGAPLVSPDVPALPAGEPLRNADGQFEWEDYLPTKLRIDEVERIRRESFVPKIPNLIDFGHDDLAAAANRIRLPAAGAHPEVTIIIPAYNQAKFTVECLASIAACADALTTFEVIVADDKSTDDTASLLAKIPHLRLIKGKRNVGFLRNCNNAATHAKGEFLLFLNNDTQVTRGWLTELVKAVRGHENCAAAGPKLIYPTGHLQEAGATLRQDCTTEMIGLNDDPGLQRYNYVRDVDYCSGACLLINTAVFRELGGFDDAYAPAYCEDADLCLRVRQAGYRVVYCANAEVVHHLSKTSDEVSADYKIGCIAKNLQMFAHRWQSMINDSDEVRLIAFYLPQFHPIPENDAWWGKGFTEWTNVAKARPNFVGHYQPRLPADFGYYDLRVAEVMERQAQMARRYGIHGFCFYYYWFASRRLLEYPIERILETNGLNMPFCLCWANENWTRRWDGQDHEILIAQDHSDEDDVSVIRDLIRYFKHPHYIRIHDKPLILVYRVSLFPEFRRTAEIWRRICHDEGIGSIYIVMAESFELVNDSSTPELYGCDAAVEFPPHGSAATRPPTGSIVNPDFSGYCADYREFAVSYATRAYPGYKRFRCVMPGWDNTARRQNDGFVFEHSTPGAFQALLQTAIAQTRSQFCGGERLVFINAWNEWAEGAYLEPDRRFGHTYLEAVLNAKQAALLLRENGVRYLGEAG